MKCSQLRIEQVAKSAKIMATWKNTSYDFQIAETNSILFPLKLGQWESFVDIFSELHSSPVTQCHSGVGTSSSKIFLGDNAQVQ